MEKEELKKLVEEMKGWKYPSLPGKLLAVEDDNGLVHLITKEGYTRATMPKKVYKDLKEYGVSRSG